MTNTHERGTEANPTAFSLLSELDMLIEDVTEVSADDEEALHMERVGDLGGDHTTHVASMTVNVNGKRMTIIVVEDQS